MTNASQHCIRTTESLSQIEKQILEWNIVENLNTVEGCVNEKVNWDGNETTDDQREVTQQTTKSRHSPRAALTFSARVTLKKKLRGAL